MTKPEITPEYVKELLEGITPGEWDVVLDGSVFSVRTNNIILVEEPESGYSLKFTEGGAYLPVDLNLMAAAPRIAEAYLKLAEKYPDISNTLTGALMIEAASIILDLQEENARLHSIIEKQCEALEWIRGFPRPGYDDQGNNSNHITVITRMCLMIDIADNALAAIPQEYKEGTNGSD